MKLLVSLCVLSLCIILPADAANTPAGNKCGSFGWNLGGCDCAGATAACSVDSSKCNAPSGVFPIAYTNIGRCKGDCPAGATGNRGSAGEGGWNEPWVDFARHPAGRARTERLLQQAAQRGFKAFEPDNTAEKVTPEDLRFMVDMGQKYGLKVVIKNDEGAWVKLLQQYPQYRQNIAMVLEEDCAKNGDCGKYNYFVSQGIPVVAAEYQDSVSASRMAQAAQQLKGAGMLIPNRTNVRAATQVGSICVDGSNLAPGKGPTPEQIAALGQGQQPYQQTQPPTSQPGAGPSGSPTGVQGSNYNPGAGQWKQSDFDRLQKDAKPSFLDPNKQLPKDGGKNPFAKGDSWDAEEKRKKVAAEKKVEGKEKTQSQEKETTFYDPLGGSVSAATNDEASAEKKKSAIKTFGDAKIRCMPQKILRGAAPTLAWSCGRTATRSEGIGFSSRGNTLGSVRVRPVKTTTLGISCYDGDALVGKAQCTITVSAEKPADESFVTGVEKKGTTEASRKLCVFNFCI
jgi:hypothetical protein